MMKKTYLNYSLFFALLLMLFSHTAWSQDVKVDARLDNVSIPLGGQTLLHLSIQFPAKDSVKFPALKDTINAKVQIVESKTDTAFNKDDVSIETITRHIRITSFEPGTYTIPSFTFTTSKGSFATKELTLQVLSVDVDTTKAFYDIKQPLTVSYTLMDWIKDNWMLIAGILLFIAAAVAVFYYLKKRPKRSKEVKEVKAAVPEHELALQKLQALRYKKLWQQEQVKLYHSELSDIVREYLEKRYLIKALEQTSGEILSSLRSAEIQENDRAMLRQIITLADLVKFAKERPLPADNERSMENAVSFVENTKKTQQTTVNKEDNSSNGLT
ncbi:hypothetical protein [Arcticibacter tournemirensis]|nr:hypothetical protein [Arcticibacter tournemirensis]